MDRETIPLSQGYVVLQGSILDDHTHRLGIVINEIGGLEVDGLDASHLNPRLQRIQPLCIP
jgi:hypothetical protein